MVPRDKEVLGRVTKISGASRFVVMCTDNKERTCSIPGRYRRRFWIKVNDVVLVKPWVVQSNERGDILWRYSRMDADVLRRDGFMNNL